MGVSETFFKMTLAVEKKPRIAAYVLQILDLLFAYLLKKVEKKVDYDLKFVQRR